MFAPLHVNPRVYTSSAVVRGNTFRATERTKLFSRSLSLLLSTLNGGHATEMAQPLCAVAAELFDASLMNGVNHINHGKRANQLPLFFSAEHTRFNEPFLVWLSPKSPVDISFACNRYDEPPPE